MKFRNENESAILNAIRSSSSSSLNEDWPDNGQEEVEKELQKGTEEHRNLVKKVMKSAVNDAEELEQQTATMTARNKKRKLDYKKAKELGLIEHKDVKTRQELADVITEAKKNDCEYRVSRSIKEGYRFNIEIKKPLNLLTENLISDVDSGLGDKLFGDDLLAKYILGIITLILNGGYVKEKEYFLNTGVTDILDTYSEDEIKSLVREIEFDFERYAIEQFSEKLKLRILFALDRISERPRSNPGNITSINLGHSTQTLASDSKTLASGSSENVESSPYTGATNEAININAVKPQSHYSYIEDEEYKKDLNNAIENYAKSCLKEGKRAYNIEYHQPIYKGRLAPIWYEGDILTVSFPDADFKIVVRSDGVENGDGFSIEEDRHSASNEERYVFEEIAVLFEASTQEEVVNELEEKYGVYDDKQIEKQKIFGEGLCWFANWTIYQISKPSNYLYCEDVGLLMGDLKPDSITEGISYIDSLDLALQGEQARELALELLADEDVDESFKKEEPQNKLNEEKELLVTIKDFKPWAGAVNNWKQITDANKVEELNSLLTDLYPDGISSSALNDLIWFEKDWVFNQLGIGDTLVVSVKDADEESEEPVDDEEHETEIEEPIDVEEPVIDDEEEPVIDVDEEPVVDIDVDDTPIEYDIKSLDAEPVVNDDIKPDLSITKGMEGKDTSGDSNFDDLADDVEGIDEYIPEEQPLIIPVDDQVEHEKDVEQEKDGKGKIISKKMLNTLFGDEDEPEPIDVILDDEGKVVNL